MKNYRNLSPYTSDEFEQQDNFKVYDAITTGGGGGGDATAANQVTQIFEATTTNSNLNDVKTNQIAINNEQLAQTAYLDAIYNSFLDGNLKNSTIYNSGLSGDKSVFKDKITETPVFWDFNGDSVFSDAGSKISYLSTLIENQRPTTTTNVIGFSNATQAGLIAAVQADLRANTGKIVLNISYFHDNGGTGFHCVVTYR